MQNRMVKFILMLIAVVAVGSIATWFNLSLQEKHAPQDDDFVSYRMQNGAAQGAAYLAEDQETAWEESASTTASKETAETASQDAMPELEALVSGEDTEDSAACEQETQKYVWEKEESGVENKQTYYARLEEIERVQASLQNAAAKESMAKQQSAAEKVLQLWDDELNAIYQRLRDALSTDEFHQLRDEERAWIRSRDEAASQAAARENYSNSSQNLAYTRNLIQWTKERVYELAEMYYGQ